MGDWWEYWREMEDGEYRIVDGRWQKIDTGQRFIKREGQVSVDTVNSPQTLWNTYFLGMQCVQFWSDLQNWDRFLEARPGLRRVIELGSGSGAFSLYLHMQCLQRGMQFATFEMFPPPAGASRVARLLELERVCYVENIWGAGGKRIREWLADPGQHPLVLFCDDGEKPREFREFAPLLWPGDFVAVHDFWNEFTQLDIDAAKLGGLVKEVFVEESEARGTLTRWYERT